MTSLHEEVAALVDDPEEWLGLAERKDDAPFGGRWKQPKKGPWVSISILGKYVLNKEAGKDFGGTFPLRPAHRIKVISKGHAPWLKYAKKRWGEEPYQITAYWHDGNGKSSKGQVLWRWDIWDGFHDTSLLRGMQRQLAQEARMADVRRHRVATPSDAQLRKGFKVAGQSLGALAAKLAMADKDAASRQVGDLSGRLRGIQKHSLGEEVEQLAHLLTSGAHGLCSVSTNNRLREAAVARARKNKKLRASKRSIKQVQKVLDAGITLEIPSPRGIRQFVSGQITGEVRGEDGWIRTTHIAPGGNRNVYLGPAAWAELSRKAAWLLANPEEMQARIDAKKSRARSFLDL